MIVSLTSIAALLIGLLVPLDGSDLVHHLLLDKLLKMGIVLLAVVVVGIGMVIIWRRSGTGSG
ncbi:hypothetical protein [Microlunatus soli]|uniref:Uncharacterized protein n=1 Tax=Microlunatus soli TaxID=630515 RepID=A0A1H1VS24_9ACTN|nr:hypothetical protein [Microlunatus soli]SDS87724.1 hypothetical protein SAMN04489812_3333 [Microlunatus soli]